MMKLSFSRQGFEKHTKKIQELEDRVKELQGETHDISESEGKLEDNPAMDAMNHEVLILNQQLDGLYKERQAAKIIEYPGSVDKVCLGCRVEILRDGRKEAYNIVGYNESNIAKQMMAYSTPMATAMMGHKPGDKFIGKIGAKDQSIEILAVYALK